MEIKILLMVVINVEYLLDGSVEIREMVLETLLKDPNLYVLTYVGMVKLMLN